LEATSIAGILDDIALVARALSRESTGHGLIEQLRARLTRISAAVAGRPRVRVACLEWIAPPFSAGHWVPEQVDLAGGIDVLGSAGARSREVTWDEVVRSAPDVVVLALCGFDARRALAESRILTKVEEWSQLRAVRTGRAFALDGNAYFSRPGPRVVDGAQLLASVLHPGAIPAPDGAAVIQLAG
jgi:iron complex transport system substrate-binding protein